MFDRAARLFQDGGPMRLSDCHNIDDFRKLAKGRLPFPVFDYIDGAADDELTKGRNTAAFSDCDLVPDVLAGVGKVGAHTALSDIRESVKELAHYRQHMGKLGGH